MIAVQLEEFKTCQSCTKQVSMCVYTHTICMHIYVLPSRKIYKNPIWSIIQHVKEGIRMYIGYIGTND